MCHQIYTYTYPAAGATAEFLSLSLASLESALTSFSSLKWNNTIRISDETMNSTVCSNGYADYLHVQQIIGREYFTWSALKIFNGSIVVRWYDRVYFSVVDRYWVYGFDRFEGARSTVLFILSRQPNNNFKWLIYTLNITKYIVESPRWTTAM